MFLTRQYIRCFEHQLSPIYTTAVRCFAPKSFPMADPRYRGEAPRRYGYDPHFHTRGLLPRLKIKEKRLNTMPLTAKEDSWSLRQARMGENDMIKIMSDEDIEQHELLTHIPEWLRGYRNTHSEYSVLLRKRKEFSHWQYSKPTKWHYLEARIKFLYKRINNKLKPPDVELLNKPRY